MDMTTRQIILPEHDPRNGDKWDDDSRTTEHISCFVRKEIIDSNLQFDGIKKLAALGYDWEGNVMRLMDERLSLEIGGAHFDSLKGKYTTGPTYGYNYLYSSVEGRPGVQTHTNIVTLSAEMLWPMLVPQISASEKIVASFALATTLLHELSVRKVPWLTYIVIPSHVFDLPLTRLPITPGWHSS